jgi:hypothetical protein
MLFVGTNAPGIKIPLQICSCVVFSIVRSCETKLRSLDFRVQKALFENFVVCVLFNVEFKCNKFSSFVEVKTSLGTPRHYSRAVN